MAHTDIHRKQSNISRKNLVSSLLIGMVIGLIPGVIFGWVAHRFYADQRTAQTLICREKHANQPAVQVDAICGSRF